MKSGRRRSTARSPKPKTAPAAGERYVERFIDLLWDGIGNSTP